MRNFRITVDGTPYEVSVEELDASDAGAAMSASHATAAPRAATPVARSAPAASPTAPPVTRAGVAAPGDVASPLAGTVVSVEVTPGQQVNEGQPLVVLEAMKMNTHITASHSGTVSAVFVAAGASVTEGQILLSIG